jgi:superfamily I DNA/RNA helicase
MSETNKLYDDLNEEQKLVVFAKLNKHIRIIAGAGSGKTTTILFRIKYLLEKDVDPKTILVTTFNVDAAEVLKDRLRNKLKIDEKILKKMFIGTIDSISYRFYKMYFSQNSYRGVQEFSTELLKFLKTENNFCNMLTGFLKIAYMICIT